MHEKPQSPSPCNQWAFWTVIVLKPEDLQVVMIVSLRTIGVFVVLLVARTSYAQVIVNEFCVANYSDYAVGGEFEDWVEFYNPGATAANLTGFFLSDDATNPDKWEIPAGFTVPANGYRLILISGTGDYDPGFLGQINTNFKITQTAGESIVFSDPAGNVLESYTFGTTISPNQANQSWGRVPNGSATWAINTEPSPLGANAGLSGAMYSPKPTASVEAGYYGGAINVALASTEAGATIRYTLDGSVPTPASNLYTGPINIAATSVLRARAFSADPTRLPSFIETNTYFFGADQHSVYTVNVTGPTLSDGFWTGDEISDIEFFAPNGTFITEAHGDTNEHGNDSNAYDQRGFDYVTRDALGYNNGLEHPLFQHTDRDHYERLIFKAAANDNYPFSGGAHVRDAYVCELSILGDLHLDERKTESCIVYLNGEYWGVYEFREKVDDIDYTDEYYDQPEGFVDFLKTWGGTWEEYGSGADWYTLVNFITTNDMTVQANYDYVLTQYNTMSLIDYFILNGYVVATDWLNWNTAWWRGRHPDGDARRWRYALWDNDATFGHYVNYTGVDNTTPNADPCQIDGMGDVGGQGHIPVLNALFNNEDFFADYIQRYASLSNSIFSCEQMTHVLDSMINVIEPEMQRHCNRWGGTVNQWQANVATLRNFILARCNDEVIGGIEDCYDVTALTLTVMVEGVGEIEVEEISITNETGEWSGTFFADLGIDLQAQIAEGAGACGSFVGWEIVEGTGVIDDAAAPETQISISTDVTLVARFSAPASGPIVLMTDLQLPNAGTITINGTAQAAYPNEQTFEPGEAVTLSVEANEWFTFTGWEAIHSLLDPNNEATTITLNPCTPDTIIALFDWTPNAALTVNIEPAGIGEVRMGGVALTPLPWTDQLEADVNYSFSTSTTDPWAVFSHWEIQNHTVLPADDLQDISFVFTQDDTLTAVYTIIPHSAITVQVEPPYAGIVTFGTGWSTETEETQVVENSIPIAFNASPDEFWNFKGYTSKDGHPISPSPLSAEAEVRFDRPDTIIALFEREPFVWYFPNSFTPNDDGLNDFWRVQGNAIDPQSFELNIFNRWGEVVFESNDIAKVWDGSHQDGEHYVADAIYVYRVKLKSVFDNQFEEYSGTITVFR
jgi:gliding motility-associated-like protein